jgi:hypothetical protein
MDDHLQVKDLMPGLICVFQTLSDREILLVDNRAGLVEIMSVNKNQIVTCQSLNNASPIFQEKFRTGLYLHFYALNR